MRRVPSSDIRWLRQMGKAKEVTARGVSAVLAVGLGARVIEKHLCISNDDDTADAFFSLNQSDFADMVRDVRLAEQALGEVCYSLADSERGNTVYRRSILVVKAVEAGESLRPEHVRIARPSAGIKPKYYDRVIGATVKRSLKPGEPLQWQDLEVNG